MATPTPTASQVLVGDDRILRVNGRRFFPIGARHMPVGATPVLLQKTGFNCLRWMAFGGDANTIAATQLPKDLGGLMFYPYVFNRADFSQDAESRRRELTELVLSVREHPSLLCYEQRNEPSYTFRDHATAQGSPEGMAEGSRVLRELDPHHPIRVGHINCNLVSTLKKFNPAVDILGCNPYIVSPPGLRLHVGCRPDGLLLDSPNQTLSTVGDHTTKMMRVAEGRAVWMQIQAMANENWFSEVHTPENKGSCLHEHHRLYPTRWQMRFMAFNAIIRGATAMEWAMYKTPVDSPVWMDIQKVIGELHELHDVLASPVWKGTLDIEYKELGFSDWTGVETLVKLHDGKVWILAANTQFDPMEATFGNLPEGVSTHLAVHGEDRQVVVKNGAFTDFFAPYEVHIYGPA